MKKSYEFGLNPKKKKVIYDDNHSFDASVHKQSKNHSSNYRLFYKKEINHVLKKLFTIIAPTKHCWCLDLSCALMIAGNRLGVSTSNPQKSSIVLLGTPPGF
jgi:hypothetical protein